MIYFILLYIFNAISIENLDDHGSPLIHSFSLNCYDLLVVVSYCFLYDFEFRAVLLLAWLPFSQSILLLNSEIVGRGYGFMHFWRVLVWKWMQHTRSKLEFTSQLALLILIANMLPALPHLALCPITYNSFKWSIGSYLIIWVENFVYTK